MSFCRITGRSRGLPKPNYFPLLPPISPADAKRFCRITGKSYGLPTHHYIPVLLGVHSHDKSRCKITNASGLGPHHYTAGLIIGEKKKHVILKDYRYVFPILEGEGEQQRALRDLLDAKQASVDEEDSKFVYTVEERRCSLVFPARLEAAVRDGDVRDVMLSRDCDTVLLRLRQGKNVSVDFKNLEDFDNLYDGLGPREDVLKERERLEAEARRRKRKRQAGLNYAKKIFEEKEKAAEEEETRRTKQLKLRSVKEEIVEEKLESWRHVDLENARSRACHLANVSSSCKDASKSLRGVLDWSSFKDDASNLTSQPIVDRMPKPLKVDPLMVHQNLDASCMSPVSESTGGFEAISVVKPLTPLNVEPDRALQSALMNISRNDLRDTADVSEKFSEAGEEALELLPRVEEIPKLVENIGAGEKTVVHNVKGLKLDVKSAQRFVAGQTVETPAGPVFVPGQTLRTPQGPSFVPGFTVNTPDGPLLIPGQVLNVKDQDGKQTPVFVAGQTLATEQGQTFVQGQTLHNNEGARFVQGQTVLTDEGPKFVAGRVVADGSFVPGQTIVTPEGARFMPGQTVTDHHGDQIFVPGQSVQVDDAWQFVPGQCVESSTGEVRFVPGQTILSDHGAQFVPGQYASTKSGESRFVPGIATETDKGLVFLPGMTLDTPKGAKFVEGQIMKTPEGERFVPGRTTVDKDEFQFAAASKFDEVVFTDAGPVGIPVDPKTANATTSSHQKETFGHMVQTEKGVEFIPEGATQLPDGKRIVPGQLVRGGKDGPRFVPGVMTDDGFLPGQIVTTEKGEQFVPGQVIDTSGGPKFVPGQMVDTRTGPKFVPGQTIETADGPRFVPGQIVETKVGPTFIPGQVISTEDEGSRFVPGQVVDTPDGPRFVPGRVVESGELGVTFVPGQIVQTEEGPRFVAPDLTDTPEGELEFSVQGFEVTPEELRLLRPQHLHYSAHSQHHGETSIDARMLRQLSEAGLSVGRKVLADLPSVDVDVDPKAVALEQALEMAEKLGLRGSTAVKMAQIVSIVAQLSRNIALQQENVSAERLANGTDSCVTMNGGQDRSHGENGNESGERDEWLRDAVKTAMTTAVLAINGNYSSEDNEAKQDLVYSSISEAFNVLLRRKNVRIEQSVDEILRILLVPQNRSELCRGALLELVDSRNSKVDILRSTVIGKSLQDDVVLDRLSMVLEEEHGTDLVGPAFRTVSRNDPGLVSRVLRKVSQEVDSVATEREAAETVHKAIVHAVRESSEIRVKELLNDEASSVREMLLQAVGLARALGMSTTAGSLLQVISDEKSTRALASDRVTLDVLKRLTVMRKLAEERPPYANALGQLCSDPELARSDPRLRTLVRESAALMIVPEEAPLQSSADVPTSLMQAENSLAMEEFLMRRSLKTSSIFMILKQGLQAVVPREASRSVLTGEVAYTVLDEDGIHHFEPLHVFSALRLNRPAAHRFSMYCCPVAKEEDLDAEMLSTFTGTTSVASSLDGSSTIGNGAKQECNGVAFSRSDRSCGYSASRENTPSFKRLSSIGQESNNKSLDNYIVVKDHTSDTDGFSVNVGDIVEALEYADPAKRMRVDPELEIGIVGDILDNSAARHKLSVRPRRKHADPRARTIARSSSDSSLQRVYVRTADGREGWLPMNILMQTSLSEESSTVTGHHRPEDSHYRREAVIKELVETEEEFGRDLQLVVERYLKPLDNPDVPRIVRDNKEIIFTNLKQIADFHNTSFGRVLIEGVKYYADQPRMLGKTFLRLERDFDKHVAYCRDEPAAQEFLQMNDVVREYFEELSQTLGDDKSVSEHLKLPIQRINDYQLLLKELVKYSTRLGENCDDLQKALELMLGIPHRATDNKFISNIEGYKGNIHKLGRLLTHEWFTVIDKDGKTKERYLFLFKARILVCKVRRISEDRSVFVLKDIIRLPEVELKDHPEDIRSFELHSPEIPGYPITLVAHKDPVKACWLKEIRQYASDLVALAEHAADDLQLTEVPDIKEDGKHEKVIPVTVDPPRAESARVEPAKVLPPKAEPTKPAATKADSSKQPAPKLVNSNHSPGIDLKSIPNSIGNPNSKSNPNSNPNPNPSPNPNPNPNPNNNPGPPAKPEEQKALEKRKEGTVVAQDSEAKKAKVEDKGPDMSRRYSSSRYSASSKLVEEYSSVSSSRNGVSAYMESASVSASAARSSSSTVQGSGRIVESSSSYQTAITGAGGSDTASNTASNAASNTARVTLGTTDSGKPMFVKTIEGCQVEPNRAKKAMIHAIAGEVATFECTLLSADASTKMQWLKDNKPLEDKLADRVTTIADDKSFKLQIQNVHESDSGIYIARAMNGESQATCTAQLIVQELTAEEKKARAEANAPIFLVRLKDTELLENTYLRFMIKVKGDPNPEMKFYKDGVLIDSKHERVRIVTEKADRGFYELVIADVQKVDAGKYSCTAMNRFGEASCEATVTVTDEKPIFIGLPEGLLEPGEEPHFTWLRDGQPFDPEERFKVLFKDNEDTLALVFQHVKPEDAGLYTCVAQTSTGNISCSAELTVQGAVHQLLKDPEKPKLQSESRQSEVSVGGSAMLDLQVKGYPKPDIKWTKDGEEIIAGGRIKYLWEDEESLSLVIKHVTAKDAGVYTIRAKNDLGEDTTQIELIVKSAPKITKKQTDMTVLVEETMTMVVQIEATPAPEVKWYKDGQVVEESERVTIVKEASDTYKLIVKDVRMDDSGSYSIVARNEINQTTEMWNVSVRSPPKIKKRLGEPPVVDEGDTLTLYIEVESDSEANVKWYKDEQVIVEDQRTRTIREGNNYMLKITGMVGTDAAIYKAEVTNKYGSLSDQTRVQVRGVPRFKTRLSDVSVNEGATNVELEVEVDGFPKPSVHWYIGDTEITEKRTEFTRIEEGDNCRLVIKEAKSALTNTYTCKVKNEYGETKTSATLTVNTKPKLIKKLADQRVKEGDTLKLTVELSGTPDPEIKWFKDGQEVSADARIKITRDSKRKESYDLTVTLVKGSDGGVYEVKAHNDLGEVTSKSKVIVLTKTEEKVEEQTDLQKETVEKVAVDEDEVKSKKAKEEDVEPQRQEAEESGPEGRVTLEKQSIHVVRGKGDTITISVASTTTHESVMTGPDERHSISKMTATKVECQEMNTEGPSVEEIASYSYTIHEDSGPKPQNGVVIEEFSEASEDSRAKLQVNRGVSIVSVSDDESTLKAISRDVSTDDMQCAELSEDHRTVNGTYEEFTGYGTTAEERILESVRPQRASIVTETIMEERSVEESIGMWSEEVLEGPRNATVAQSKLSRQTSKSERVALSEKVVEEDLEQPQNAVAEKRRLSRQSSKTERVDSIPEQVVEKDLEQPQNAVSEKRRLSRQSSKTERIDSVPEQVVEKDLEQPQNAVSEKRRLSRQSSKMERANSIPEQVVEKDLEQPQSPTVEKRRLSRQSSKIERVDSIPEQVVEKDLEQPQSPIVEKRRLSRQSSKIERVDSIPEQVVETDLEQPQSPTVEKRRLSRQSSKIERVNSIPEQAVETDLEQPQSPTVEKRRLSRQSSKIERVNSIPEHAVEEVLEKTQTPTVGTRKLSKQLSKTDSSSQKQVEEASEQPQTATVEKRRLSRQSSKLERTNSVAEKGSVEDTNGPQNATMQNGLSRQSSKMERTESVESVKLSRKTISRENSQKAVLADGEVDEELEALLDRVKRQRSVLDDILDKESGRESAPPHVISTNLGDKTIFETQSTTFQVKASGLPRPDAKWYKDGKPLRSGERMRITNSGETYEAELSKATLDDAGIYMLMLTNKLGEEIVDGSLSVGTVDELRKPRFIDVLEDVDVAEGGSGVFKASFTADPIPEITWCCRGLEISTEDRMKFDIVNKPASDKLTESAVTLKIPDCSRDDTGEYTLKLKNKYGEAEASAFLSLLLRPEIEEFKDLTAPLEELVQWEVIVKGNPKPTVMWIRNGEELQKDERFDMHEDRRNNRYKLIIKSIGLEDGGTYTVKAKNYLGETTAEAQLNVHTEVPTFITELSDTQVSDREDLELRVRADGIPKPRITWFKDGVKIMHDDRHETITHVDGIVSSSLAIKTFSAEDIGRITCEASNTVGKSETSCKLDMVLTEPSFTKPGLPRSLDVDEGEPLELKVKVDGSPIPQVSWFKDGEEITPDDHVQIETLPDGTTKLRIERAAPTDCGAYKLVTKNTSGDLSALCAVAITPQRRKPSFSKPLEDAKAVVGEPLRLEAQVVAFPNPQVQWFKDGLPLRPTKEVNFVNEPNGLIGLSIDTVRPEDAGTYSVVVSNSLGETTGTAKVEVEEREKRPDFVASLQPLTVVEGFPAKLEVKTSGKPVPSLQWLHNGDDIVPDGKHIKIVSMPDGSHALIIDKATPEDAGEYQVIAANTEGTASCKANLDVAGRTKPDEEEQKPAFIHPIRDVSVEEGEPLVLSAAFVGNPIPDVSWTRDGQPLTPSERLMTTCDGKKVKLEVNPSETKDTGVYRCRLSNPLGEDAAEAKATVKQLFLPPSFNQRFSDIQQLPSFDAKFPARITGIPKPEVTWHFNDRPIVRDDEKYKIKRDGDVCCLYVKDCTYDDAGRYKCRAVNRGGTAECEASLSVVDKIEKTQKMEPPAFLKRIGDCEVYRGMPAKFTACVTGYPEPDFEWYRNGDRLWQTDRIRMEQEGSLLRLILSNVDELDAGKYVLKIVNPHGEDSCSAEMVYESLEPRAKRPLADQYTDYDKYRKSGLPFPLADRPIISRMMDRHLTLSWKPSIPVGPRAPVTYLVEMCELPDGDWFTVRSGIRSCACDIRNLEPFRDYKFRIRVENKYGISDPSPFAQTYRAKLEPDPPKFFPYLPPGIDFRPETSPYFPKDFDIERPLHDGYAQAPRFLRQEYDTQYGVKNHNCSLFWFVYGYPKPRMTYYFNDQPIQSGGRYDQSYTRNGQATLFINRMLERDEGMYEAVATNEHGEARQRVRLQIAEYPTFIERPDETVVMVRKTGQLVARVTGVPFPEIKWYKDWKPIASSTRIRIQFIEPNTSILTINEAIAKDEGLYSISARNVAGSVSCSAMIHIEENEHEFGYRTYRRKTDVKPRDRPFGDQYDLGDELGRGTQGVAYHAVERSTGRNYAAKVMHGRGELKPFMYNEMDAMNNLHHRKLLRLHDAYETDKSVTLVMELAAGGELVDTLTKQSHYTEYEIASYIRQLLWGLEYMHGNHYAHLGLTLGDLLISHPGGDDLKIGDFGLARRIAHTRLMTLAYGMPEYVAPEVTNNEGVDYSADMWSVGIITYILLSGISPFRGMNDKETLAKIREGTWEFDDRWRNISNEAQDFIRSLLVYNVDKRIDVTTALAHPWLTYIEKPPPEPYRIPSENLKNYYKLYRDWYSNASCRTWYRRRKLSSAFEHPSRMVYPPGHKYTPEPADDRTYSPTKKPVARTWENQVPSREPIDTEIGIIQSESHYQNGPDTYLLQLRDTDFPVRLREYMKVACNRSPGYSRSVAENNGFDWRTPIIRERRRFTDVMDEEIDDERRARINRYGSADTYTLRRLKHELGTRLDSYVEAEAMIESKKAGHPPFFREKPPIRPIEEGKPAQLVCLAVGSPKPLIQWYKNDMVIQEGNRIKITEDAEGRSILSLNPAKEHDIGIYKIVARNSIGQTVVRTRLVLAVVPTGPDSPEAADVSESEVLLRWKQPKYDGNSAVLCYNLQYREGDSIDWIDIASNIDHEFYLVRDLKPDTSYNFRLAARNRIGWSEKGIPSKLIKTRPVGAPKVQITSAMRHLQDITESGQEVVLEEDKPHIDYSAEEHPIEWTSDSQLSSKYTFISELSRGQFSVVAKGVDKSSDRVIVAKIMELRPDTEKQVNREFDALRSLRHERIAMLEAAYKAPGSPVAVFVMEKLQGADVLTYFASRHEYTENCVAMAVTQILDGLQYLHWRGYCHLDIQPDNVVMSSVRSVQVKLVDMGSAQKVSKLGTVVPMAGHPEYRAPEVYNDEPAHPQTDIWMVGVLTYVLLSGVSPFRGKDADETRQNITFVRYRFEYLYKELSQEATRFLMLLFKRAPSKRPVAEECHEHRWLVPSEFMIKKRERAVFLGNRLKEYNEEYHAEKEKIASESKTLASECLLGAKQKLIRSTSIQEELLTTF